MSYSFNKSIPIYLQLMDRIKRKIIKGELNPGAKLSSIREMAVQFEITPNTVQRTYAEMERLGLIESRRGQGSFVTNNPETLIQLREELKHKQIHDFVLIMKEAGFDSSDILLGVKNYLNTIVEEKNQ